jgi:hypothetical protein
MNEGFSNMQITIPVVTVEEYISRHFDRFLDNLIWFAIMGERVCKESLGIICNDTQKGVNYP